MRRFVVLHHADWPGHPDHYDLMLETRSGGDPNERVLRTFSTRANRFPDVDSELIEIAEHRRAYLEYEGPVSDSRGKVVRVEAGGISALEQARGGWVFTLDGEKLRGSFELMFQGKAFVLKRAATQA